MLFSSTFNTLFLSYQTHILLFVNRRSFFKQELAFMVIKCELHLKITRKRRELGSDCDGFSGTVTDWTVGQQLLFRSENVLFQISPYKCIEKYSNAMYGRWQERLLQWENSDSSSLFLYFGGSKHSRIIRDCWVDSYNFSLTVRYRTLFSNQWDTNRSLT